MNSSRYGSRRESILDVLYGGDVPSNIPDVAERIVNCLMDPRKMYLHIENIVEDPAIEDMRIHLARIQIDSELHMREDVDHHTQRLWAAQTMERMIFGGLMVEGEKVVDDGED